MEIFDGNLMLGLKKNKIKKESSSQREQGSPWKVSDSYRNLLNILHDDTETSVKMCPWHSLPHPDQDFLDIHDVASGT